MSPVGAFEAHLGVYAIADDGIDGSGTVRSGVSNHPQPMQLK